jgi:hypothetical protein
MPHRHASMQNFTAVPMPLTPPLSVAEFSQSSRDVRIILGEVMKKLAFAFAVGALLVLVAGPVTNANAQNKKLWEGWIEELQKARGNVVMVGQPAPAAPAKKK